MLHRLSDHISNCYALAADAQRRADQTSDPERMADFLIMARSWTQLAQSHELSEELERALVKRMQDAHDDMEWKRATVAPFDRDLELAVIGAGGIRPIKFACRRILNGWVAADSRTRVDIQPTHWRAWMSGSGTKPVRTPAQSRGAAAGSARRAYLLPLQSNE